MPEEVLTPKRRMKFINRKLETGMGMAVARRTYLRRLLDKQTGRERWESWEEVADRVARGNTGLLDKKFAKHAKEEYALMKKHISNGSMLMSGRHLQHGDESQKERNMEVFTNCFDKNTKFLTQEYGAVSFGEVEGKTVTVKARDGEWRTAKVKGFGTQKLYKITFGPVNNAQSNNNLEVIATKNHRWFLKNGSVTEDLQVGDIIEPAKAHLDLDTEGIRHGLIYGDGTGHKSRNDYPGRIHSQGRQYNSIRLCGDDKNYLKYFKEFTVTYPPHANGDPVVYLGQKDWKDLPFTKDPSYIAGFIHGWWLADGSKTYPTTKGIEISTANTPAVEWLKEHAPFAGYIVTGFSEHQRKEGDGSYPHGEKLVSVRLAQNKPRKVLAIKEFGEDQVFCVEEPITTGFVLANGLLTGNCSTATSTYILFYLLMNGSGVGRPYDDDMCVVNWDNMPNVRCVIAEEHPDFAWGVDESVRDAEHKYGHGDGIHWFEVPDSREGWAQAIEKIEVMAFEKKYKDDMLILDFSKVRAKGQPIRGMQNRPSSGPKPIMNAIAKLATIKGANMSPWKQAMFADHYTAECVLVGGARRSARIATKNWTDPEIFDFINIKRGGFLWSANNSVAVDDKFWKQRTKHAHKVLAAITKASYEDGTGEPGFINQHKLVQNDDGYDDYQDGHYAESKKYTPMKHTYKMLSLLARNAASKVYSQIPNPCGEISLNMLGGYCVIGDVVPFYAPTLDDAEEAFRATTRALIRVNTYMDSLYNREVKRTNRIGVGMTGIHEFAWNMYGYSFHDLIDEEKSQDFWNTLARFKRAVVDEAEQYSKKLGMNVPHTNTTIKPSGTISKLFALTEGAHLPSMREYIRWVQYRSDDPQVKKYKAKGYPVKELRSYSGSTAVGFPTQPLICRLGMGGKLVTAAEAKPEEQYKWLMLLEKYWIVGVDAHGKPLEDTGNQVSYTLKYDPTRVTYKEYADMVDKYQGLIKCCSVMPQQDATAYEYQPEQPVTISEFMRVINEIEKDENLFEDIDYEHLKCDSGACPI